MVGANPDSENVPKRRGFAAQIPVALDLEAGGTKIRQQHRDARSGNHGAAFRWQTSAGSVRLFTG